MIRHLWQTHRIALFAFAAALAAMGYFGVKSISSAIYWMDPAHQDQALAEWMTPRYVGQSYKLPRELVLEALMMDPDAPPRRVSISDIAAANGVSIDVLQSRIDAAVASFDAEREARRNV